LKINFKYKKMYPAELIKPMREQLTNKGFSELFTQQQVDDLLDKSGTTLIVVNSVCGCAAANARPGVLSSLSNSKVPTNLATVFAGVDKESTDRARYFMAPFPPSSPCVAMFKDGELVHILERHHIEGRPAEAIAENLMGAYNEFC
jgi:putative YphP/YqiW family bacilliredoxin